MRYAVISDIHANPSALRSVLDDISRSSIDSVLCCGDLVGYNACPNETVELVRASGIAAIAGNHDLLATNCEPDASGFSARTARAARWTGAVLTGQNREFLERLPRTMVVDKQILVFHGSLAGTPYPEMVRIQDAQTAQEVMAEMRVRYPVCLIGFFGHTHRAGVYGPSGETACCWSAGEGEMSLDRSCLYLVNPGSVAESRDEDGRASYAIYDNSSQQLEFRRVEFDDHEVKARGRREGLIDSRFRSLLKRGRRRFSLLRKRVS